MRGSSSTMAGAGASFAGTDSRRFFDLPLMTCIPKPDSRLHMAFSAAICASVMLGQSLYTLVSF